MIIVGFCCAAALAISGVSHAQTDVPKGDAEKGREIYTKVGCYQCHGREAQGSPISGPRLGPNPMTYPGFVDWIRRPKGEMPPYTTRVLSDADLTDIYAFVASRPQPALNRLLLFLATSRTAFIIAPLAARSRPQHIQFSQLQ